MICKKLLLCTTAIVTAYSVTTSPVRAEPQGGLVIGGAAVIENHATLTTIKQSSDRAILRWNSFDVGSGERVVFEQPSRSSITINRIHDSKASRIDGSLSANGNIVLINQNGIAFGAGSRVDVGGLIASTSDLEDDAAFMSGQSMRFTRPGNKDAAIIHNGTMTIQEGGLAGFVAPNIENNGVIHARMGKVALASGDIATIDFAGDGLIQIEVSDAVLSQGVKNKGSIIAEGGEILLTTGSARHIVEGLISNDGLISAPSDVGGGKGKIRIEGNSQTSIQNTGVIEAKGTTTLDGGDISIDGAFVSLGGIVRADGRNGGTIRINAGTLSLADTLSAQGLNGIGGDIFIRTQTTWETSTAQNIANGITSGGSIRHFAEQQIISSGNYFANGLSAAGGHIDISAWSTKFLSAKVEANGFTDGGAVRLGGEYQGGKDLPMDDVPNAYYLVMDRGTRVRAESTGKNGRGGTVILWSDKETLALGDIKARPGTEQGLGGFVEISSGDIPKFDATVETGRGTRMGTVLLDPKNILISDFSFNSTSIIMGYGYQGGRTSQNNNLDNSDEFGYAVSVDGNRMVVGAPFDDGSSNTATNAGAVYLFSFTDSTFTGGVLEGVIGSGYTGGKNINMSLNNYDYFGSGVSLDGNRLAIGAYADDGSANSLGDSGSVYLFSFSDSTFSGGTLESTLGKNYVGGKNLNVNLDGSDYFGVSVSLDGNRLAVGAFGDNASGNAKADSGAVYLFSFTDAAFNGAALQSIIGNGYTGGKNIDVTLDVSDNFARTVSLDGNQLAVGATGDDGLANAVSNAGAAYLFGFSDAAFNGGTLYSTIGYGYTGGKNINFSNLEANDYLGVAVSVNANRFVIGASGDDGRMNAAGASGNVYMFSHDNDVFDNITHQGTIGFQYNAGAKDKDLWGLNLGGSDQFGYSLALDGTRLLVGANGDDALLNNVGNAGAVYQFTFSDALFSGATLEGITGSGYSQGKNFNVTGLSDADNNIGSSISIDGQKLAIGNFRDDGFNALRPNSGAVYLYSFTDGSYSNGTLEAIIGDGYTGGKNFNQALRANDQFGLSVSLDGNRLAVGAYTDDGLANNCGDCGAVYLYSFADSTFSSIALSSRIGFGYVGAKDINMTLGGSDYFGASVALDGTRLAVGAYGDDGFGNVLNNSGAVYLFTFSDLDFNGGGLQATIGRSYTGGKNINVSNLDADDYFGYALSLDGDRLAVGAYLDDGASNARTNAGAAYLFTFADSVFTGGAQQSIIGYGYITGKNYNLALDANDYFGISLALSGNHLFSGASQDDGYANGLTDSGAVYRFDFTDAAFSGGTLGTTMGARYVGASDSDLRGYVSSYDYFGRALGVDGQNLIIGSLLDDGFGNNATDAGGIYFFQYTDMTYTSVNLLGIAGADYDTAILDKGVQSLNIKTSDYFGTAVSMDGNRIAVGAPRDDGYNDVGNNRGAVYLYSFTDAAFSGGVLEGIIGSGYVGGKNINVTLGDSDYFGAAVSLNGNRLAVGAYGDDGSTNTNTDAGAVYLYSFTDSVFSGGALESVIGRGYTGGKNINMTLDNNDYLGWSVSLDGNRLAIGAYGDDGAANARSDSGVVYLYSFSDSVFSAGVLESTIGYNYSGGKNINMTLDSSDYFGSAVALDGTMLAVGAYGDDGAANVRSDAGAVYMITFADSVFSGGTQQAIAGYNYSGGKNINVSSLEASDIFGFKVSLDGNRMAIGAEQDDGYNNEARDSGAVYLYSFSDSLFSGGTYQSTIGYKYTGGKNLNLREGFISEAYDRFGAVALDGNRLLIGAYGDDGFGSNGDSGAVVMINFADSAFTSPTIAGVLGNGYVGGKNISFGTFSYDTADNFGRSVSLDADRLVVGAANDDGLNNQLVDSGAVYLYSVVGGNYDTLVLEGMIGVGYTGGKNIDMANYLDRFDYFGLATSLDGNRLAIGAFADDGNSNQNGNAGAVYLFDFTDSAFSGGTLQARIGSGYTGGKNINASLGGSDYFGFAVSLDGNRLAVGVQRDDGFLNDRTDAGAVYLYSFSDAAFSGGILQSIIGYGYSGGKNISLTNLGATDYFGTAVSLNGNRVAIGAPNDDGLTNATTDAGAVYLLSFSDSTFTSPVLRSTIGKDYTGGSNYNMSSLFTSDTFGSAVSLDGTVLAVGAPGDHGYNLNTGGRYGAIFLYNFSDLIFSNPYYDSAVGNLYTGGKNININSNGGSFAGAISLDDGNLIVSSYSNADVTGSLWGAGRVYIFRSSLSPVAQAASYALNGSATIGITASSLSALLSAGQNIILQASNDITVGSQVLVSNGGGAGGNLTLQAGRSIFLNADIVTDDGNLYVYANENLSTGVVNSQRDSGAATIAMQTGKLIDAGAGSVVFRVDSGTGKTNTQAGDIVIANITANDFKALSGTQTGNVILNGVVSTTAAGDAIIIDAPANFVNNYGAGGLLAPSGRWLVYSDHDNFTTMNGLVDDFSAHECVYLGACSIIIPGAGNGLLYEYGPKLVTITVDTSRAYGDANPNAATLQSLFVYSGFDVGDDYTDLTTLPTASIAGTATATAAAGTTHAITLTGGSDDIYDLYLLGGFLTINKRDITAAWSGSISKAYGDINPTINTSNFTYTGLVNGDVNSAITATGNYGALDQTTVVGSYAIGAAFTSTNYNVTNSPIGTLVVNKRDITAAWVAGLTRIYGDSNPSVDTNNFIYTALVNGDTNSVLTATADYGAITGTTNAGGHSVGASFSAANYNVTNTPTTTLTINKRDITGVVNNAARAYGDSNPTWTWSDVVWSNLANAETGSVLDAMTITAPTAIGTSNAGTTHNIGITGFSDNNYNLTGYTAGTLTINKRDITGVVNNAARAYGDSNPTWTWSDVVWSNLANAETGSVLDAMTITAPTAIGTSNAGTTHNIGITGFSDNNYNLTGHTAGTLTINKRDITGTVNAVTQYYGDVFTGLDWSDVVWTNLANAETGSVLDSVSFSSPTLNATSGAATVHVLGISSLLDNNYNLASSTDGSVTVTQAPLVLRVRDVTRMVSTNNPAFTYNLTGLKNGENDSVLTGVTFTTLADINSPQGVYEITAAGGTATNYYISSYLAGELTVSAANQIPDTYYQEAESDESYLDRNRDEDNYWYRTRRRENHRTDFGFISMEPALRLIFDDIWQDADELLFTKGNEL